MYVMMIAAFYVTALLFLSLGHYKKLQLFSIVELKIFLSNNFIEYLGLTNYRFWLFGITISIPILKKKISIP